MAKDAVPLTLFVETPCGGEHGHRLLVPSGVSVTEGLVRAFITKANEDGRGANFIGLSRSVQQSINQTKRTGREILVLAGVDVAQMTEREIVAIQKSLMDRTIQKTDWASHPPGTLVVESPELNEWLNEIERNHRLPKIEWQKGPRQISRQPGSSISRVLIMALLLILGVVLALCLGMFAGVSLSRMTLQDGLAPTGTKLKSPADARFRSSRDDDYRKEIERLAREWECDTKQVCASLLRAANWDRRREANDLSVEKAAQDADIRWCLDRLQNCQKPEDRYFVAKDIESKENFRNFALECARPTSNSYKNLRKRLYYAWQKWNNLQDDANAAREGMDNVQKSEKFKDEYQNLIRIMMQLTSDQPDDGDQDTGFRDPDTPLFDRQDVIIWELLGKCKDIMVDNGLYSLFSTPGSTSVNEGVAVFLCDIRAHHKLLLENISAIRYDATDYLEKKGEKIQAESVKKAVRAFEDLIEALSRLCEVQEKQR